MDLRTGDAYWPARNGLLTSYPALRGDTRADVVVIGAGVTGALVAHALVDAGADVIVLDRRDVVAGSSAATTGLLMHETDVNLGDLIATIGEVDAVQAWRMGLAAVGTIEALVNTFDDRCGFARRPTLYLASNADDARTLIEECAVRRGHRFPADWLPPEQLRARYGFEASGAILHDGNAEIDCFRFTHHVLRRVSSRGGRVFDKTAVERVDADDCGVRVRTDRGASVQARHVVWAAGYEGVEEVQRRVGRLHSTWVVTSEPLQNLAMWPDHVMVWETARPYLYARTTDDGRLMVGGADEPFHRRHKNERLLARKSGQLMQRLAELRPSMVIEPAYEWAGVFSTTNDGLPYIGTVPEHRHAWLALGYGGNGITFSMIAADLIRDAWLGIPNPNAHIFAFDR